MLEISFQKKLSFTTGSLELDISLSSNRSEFITLIGSSGSGKTSFLRMIAGLMKADSGFLRINDKEWYNSKMKVNMPLRDRSIGYLSQQYDVFPHMTVEENLDYALGNAKEDKLKNELLEVSDLSKLSNKAAGSLSGGQKQRLSLIRSMIRRPQLLLLDEPLSALHGKMRSELQEYIFRFHQETGNHTIFVSHDIGESISFAHQVLELENGKVIKQRKGKLAKSKDQSPLINQLIVEVSRVGDDYIEVLAGLQKLTISRTELKDVSVGDKFLMQLNAGNIIAEKIM